MEVFQKFQEICSNLNENNVKEQKKVLSSLLDSVLLEQKENKRVEENYEVLDKIYCLNQKEQTKVKKKLPTDQGNITVFIGKPYLVEGGEQKKIEFFCLNKYNPATINVDSLKPTELMQQVMKSSFLKARNFLLIYPKGMKVSNKGKFVYKTYDEVIQAGKKLFGISKKINFEASKSSELNYNNLIEIFNDNISSVKKSFKYSN